MEVGVVSRPPLLMRSLAIVAAALGRLLVRSEAAFPQLADVRVVVETVDDVLRQQTRTIVHGVLCRVLLRILLVLVDFLDIFVDRISVCLLLSQRDIAKGGRVADVNEMPQERRHDRLIRVMHAHGVNGNTFRAPPLGHEFDLVVFPVIAGRKVGNVLGRDLDDLVWAEEAEATVGGDHEAPACLLEHLSSRRGESYDKAVG